MRHRSVPVLTWALVAAVAGTAAAEGPYHGRVVDAETKAPLAGAVALVYWYREAPGIGHGPSESFLGAEEAVTDAQGRFVIATNPPRTSIPGTWRSKPYLIIYHPGHASFPMHFATDPPPPTGRFTSLLPLMEQRAVTFELRPLRTPQEHAMARMLPISSIPDDQMPNLLRLLRAPLPPPPSRQPQGAPR